MVHINPSHIESYKKFDHNENWSEIIGISGKRYIIKMELENILNLVKEENL